MGTSYVKLTVADIEPIDKLQVNDTPDGFSDLQSSGVLSVAKVIPTVTITANATGGAGNVQVIGDGVHTIDQLLGPGFTTTNGQIVLIPGFEIDTTGGQDVMTAGLLNHFRGVEFYARASGASGNNIYIQLIQDGVAGSETVNVSGSSITIHVGNPAVLASTSDQVASAIAASTSANSLVNAVVSGHNELITVTGGAYMSGGQDAAYASYSGVIEYIENFNVKGVSGFSPSSTSQCELTIDHLVANAFDGQDTVLLSPQTDGNAAVGMWAGVLLMINPGSIQPFQTGSPSAGIAFADLDNSQSPPGVMGTCLIARQDILGGDSGILYFGSNGGQYYFDGPQIAQDGQGILIFGSAQIANEVRIGDDGAGGANIDLRQDGSAYFGGPITSFDNVPNIYPAARQIIGPDGGEIADWQTPGVLTVYGSVALSPRGAPDSPTAGQIYFDSSDSHFYGWNGTAWMQLDN